MSPAAKKRGTARRAIRRRQTPRPRARTAAKRVWKPRRMAPIPAIHYFDAFKNVGKPLYVPNTLGHFTTVDTRDSAYAIVGPTPLVVIAQTNPSASRLLMFDGGGTNAGQCVAEMVCVPFSETGDTKPLQIRPMRQSLRVSNFTKSDSIEGRVSVLNTSDQIDYVTDWSSDSTQWSGAWPKFNGGKIEQLIAAVENHASTQKLAAHNFTRGRKVTAAPATMFGLTQWLDFSSIPKASASTDYAGDYNKRKNAWGMGIQKRAFNTIIMVFHSVTDPQSYNIEFHAQDACVFPNSSLAGSLARAGPVGSPSAFEAVSQAAAQSTRNSATTADVSMEPGTPRTPMRSPSNRSVPYIASRGGTM